MYGKNVSMMVVVMIHFACFSLWSVNGFLVPPFDTTEVFMTPLMCPSEAYTYRRTSLAAKGKDGSDEENGESLARGLVRFFSKIIKGDKGESQEKKGGKNGESGLGRLFKRFTGDKDKKKQSSASDSVKDKDKPDFQQLFANAVSNIRSSEALKSEDMRNYEAEWKRIDDVRKGLELRRKQQQEEEKKRKEEQMAQAKAKKEAEKRAAEQARQLAKQKREQEQMQKGQRERQKKIEAAAAVKAKPDADEEEEVSEKVGVAQNFFKGVMKSFEKKTDEWIVVGRKTMMAPGEIGK